MKKNITNNFSDIRKFILRVHVLMCFMLTSGSISYALSDYYLYIVPKDIKVGAIEYKGGTDEVSDELKGIFRKYKVSNCYRSFPGASNPELNQTYEIHAVGADINMLSEELKKSGLFKKVEKAVYYKPTSCSNPSPDINFLSDLFINTEYQSNQIYSKWPLEMIEATCAWGITHGNANVVVAVVDTEFDLLHEDLQGQIVSVWDTAAYVPPMGVHGTPVTGCVNAIVDNNKGVAGIGRNIKVAGYRVHHPTGSSIGGNPWPAIWKAYKDGHRIINVSWQSVIGGSVSPADMTTVINCITEMTSNGVILVLGAGNTPSQVEHENYANIPGVINVSSVDSNNMAGPIDNARNVYVDICAPGLALTTIPRDALYPLGNYYPVGGTSIAAPFVSGTIGLMLSVNPCLNPADIEYILKATCDPIADGHLYPGLLGAGRLNAYRAVEMASTYSTDRNITTNQTWNNKRTIGGSIVVHNGATLTITDTVVMLCEKPIVVQAGGKLVVDGGVITSRRPEEFWKGIEVFGNRSVAPNAFYHGVLDVKNGAVIERAKEAICNFSYYGIYAGGGGIIKVENSTFQNCRTYLNLQDYSTSAYGSYDCRFENTTFHTSDANVMMASTLPLMQRTFGYIADVKGVVIKNCNFKMTANNFWISINPAYRGYGIYSVSSRIRVDNSTIEGFQRGLYSANTTAYVNNIGLYNNTFKNNCTGINLSGDGYGTVFGNTINNMLQVASVDLAVGIHLDNPNGTLVTCGNNITGRPDPAQPSLADHMFIGILVNNSNSFGAKLHKNNMYTLGRGIQTQLNNPQLTVTCNRNEGNVRGWAINFESGSANYFKSQGTGCGTTQLRAGNMFVNNTRSIQSYLTNYFTYWGLQYISSPHYQIPGKVGNVTVNSCYFGSNTDPNPPCDDWCIYVAARQAGELIEEYNSLQSAGKADEANDLFAEIVRTYKEEQDIKGLIAFLEKENTINSRKMLIPFYIDLGEYNKAQITLSTLVLDKEEQSNYQIYYDVLINTRKEGRRLNELKDNELQAIRLVAAKQSDLMPYAKAILEWGYNERWEHHIEEWPRIENEPWSAPQVREETVEAVASALKAALPNPSTGQTTIEAYVIAEDVTASPRIVIRNTTGNLVFSSDLVAGLNSVPVYTSGWAAGLYYYSLEINNQVVETKKLSVLR